MDLFLQLTGYYPGGDDITDDYDFPAEYYFLLAALGKNLFTLSKV